MSISKKTIINLKGHAQYFVDDYNIAKFRLSKLSSHRMGQIVYFGGEVKWLDLWDENFWKFRQMYEQLRKEDSLEYLDDKKLDRLLFELTGEIVHNKDQYKNRKIRNKKVDDFIENIEKPWYDHEVIIPILNCKLDSNEITIGDSILKNLDSKVLDEWGLIPDSREREVFENNPVMLFKVKGNNNSIIGERIRNKVKENIILLQKYVSNTKIIHDLQLLIKESSYLRFRNLSDGVVYSQWKRGFYPMILTIDDKIRAEIIKYDENLQKISSNISIKMRNSLHNHLIWFCKSIEEENIDLKIIYLSTALECLISTKNDKYKGHSIALKYMLLQTEFDEPFSNPLRILNIYDKRSNIIHGSDINICNEDDYFFLRRVSKDTFINWTKLIQKENLQKKSHLDKYLYSQEYVGDIMKWLEGYGSKNSEELVKYLKKEI